MLHPSTRRHYQPAFPDVDPRRGVAGWAKKLTGLPVIAVGSLGLDTEFGFSLGETKRISPAPICRLLDQFDAGEFDIVAIGRALLADPSWVSRLRDGALGEFTGFDADVALVHLY